MQSFQFVHRIFQLEAPVLLGEVTHDVFLCWLSWESAVLALIALYLCQAHITHLPQQCHNSKFVIFQERLLKILKCYNFLWVQRQHNCSPAASFANCVMTLYLLKVHLQTFISIPITKKCQILSCDSVVANEQYICPCFQ